MSDSKQFSNPLLAEAYDAINALGDDADFWFREIKRLAPKSIIDFGCGTGILTCALAQQGYAMTGVDPFGAMLEIAKKKPNSDKVKWVEGNYTELAELKTDLLLLTSHVAQFLLTDEEWNGMLTNAYRALNTGGHILFDSRRSLNESFAKWPTELSKRKVTDPILGEIEYWCNLLETTDTLATYELHYHFLLSDEKIISKDTIVFRTKDTIEQSLKNAGFTIKTIYGDWDGSLFVEISPEMLFVAQKS